MSTATQIPFVEYLVLDDGDPHLVAGECTDAALATSTGATPAPVARDTEFTTVRIATEGEVRAFTIVAFAAPASRSRSWPRSSTAAARACAATSSTARPIPST